MDQSLSSILVVGINYAPEPTGNAPYTSGLAEGLARLGYAVNVITGYPHYPQWRLAEGYGGLRRRDTINGIPVTRVRHTVPSAPRAGSRMLMELTFGLHSIFAKWGNPDAVIVVSPALFSSAFAVARARLFGKPVVVWVQDVYSRGIEEIVGKRSFGSRLVKRVESAILNASSGVTVIHRLFAEYVVNELHVPRGKVNVVRNWTHVHEPDGFDRAAARLRLGWGPEEIIALHAGNMGAKQGLENVVEAARVADAAGSSVRFVLVGDGNQRAKLEETGAGTRSLSFSPPLDDRSYADALRAAEVLLLNELSTVREMSVPSKLTSYFAAGRPVIAATHELSAAADEIQRSGAGVRVDPGRPTALFDAVEQLGNDPLLAASIGARGKEYAKNVLSAEEAIDGHVSCLRNALYRRR